MTQLINLGLSTSLFYHDNTNIKNILKQCPDKS